jgi:hypothetical protein
LHKGLCDAFVADDAEKKPMPTRRASLLLIFRMALMSIALLLGGHPAAAKDKGGGNENGNGRGNGGGNGNGNGGGKGNGSGGGSGKGSGSAKGSASSGSSNLSGSGQKSGSAVVRHGNGLEETIVRGRYIMKDSRGRTIVNRPASPADDQRLQTLQRR